MPLLKLEMFPVAIVRLSTLSFALFAFSSTTAIAAPVTLDYVGEVYSVGADLGGSFSIGDTVLGQITYDPALASSDSDANPSYGSYTGAVTGFDLSIGSYQATFTNSIYEFIADNDPVTTQVSDRLAFRVGANGPVVNSHNLSYMQFGYHSTDLSRLTGDEFPTLSEMMSFLTTEGDAGTNHMSFSGGPTKIVRWKLLEVAFVPEPTAMLSLLIGGGMLMSHRRTRYA